MNNDSQKLTLKNPWNLKIIHMVQIYFGISYDNALKIINNNELNIIKQNQIVSNDFSKLPLRNNYIHNGFSTLTNRKKKKYYFNIIKKRLINEIPQLTVR